MTKRPLLAGSRRIENAIGNLMDIGKIKHLSPEDKKKVKVQIVLPPRKNIRDYDN